MSVRPTEMVDLTSWRVKFSDQTPILSFILTVSYSIPMALWIGQDRNTIFETQVQLQTPGKKLPTKWKKKETEISDEHQVYLQSKHTKNKMVKISS
jgi:hypothetical protein